MNNKKLSYIPKKLLAAIVVFIFAGFACSSPDEEKPQMEQPVPVTVQTAALKQVPASYRFSGTVTSDRTVSLSTKVMGQITQLDLEEGDFARKGEVLIRIKDDNLQAQKSQAEANLMEAKATLQNTEKNYNRLKVLHEKESVTQKELDDITTQYESAKARVRALEGKLQEINDMLDYTVLEAPFDGYVVAKNASEGDMAGPGQPLISFEQQAGMKVVVTVPETQISHFKINDSVSVDVRAAGYNNITGIVSNVNPSGRRGSRQFVVEIKLPGLQKDSGIKSGMFAEVGLTSAKDSALMIPRSAIVERGQLTGIYTLNSESEVVLRWIRLADTETGEVRVLSGLAPGEDFVASFEGSLREGQKVSIQ